MVALKNIHVLADIGSDLLADTSGKVSQSKDTIDLF